MEPVGAPLRRLSGRLRTSADEKAPVASATDRPSADLDGHSLELVLPPRRVDRAKRVSLGGTLAALALLLVPVAIILLRRQRRWSMWPGCSRWRNWP